MPRVSCRSTLMACNVCTVFLEDYLIAGLPKELEIYKKIRVKALNRIVYDFAAWIHRVFRRLAWKDFEKCQETASRISRRGRKQQEYDSLLHTAAWNLLKYEVPWLEDEISYIKLLLLEAGICKGKHVFTVMSIAQELVSHLAPKALICLHTVHDDHVNPKGLMTDVSSLTQKPKIQEKEETLYDRDDDYQKEVLAEDDDLYF